MSSPEKLFEVASEQIGFLSSPNNGTLYGKWYGLNNQPYSAMFISWCFSKIGAWKLVQVSSEKGFASCSLGYDYFKNNNQLVEIKKVQQGDIVFFSQYEEKNRVNHAGIVTRVVYLKTIFKKIPVAIETIEANTSGDFGGEDGVYSRTRLIVDNNSIVGIARPLW